VGRNVGKIGVWVWIVLLLCVFSCGDKADKEQGKNVPIKNDTNSIYFKAVKAGIDTTSKSYNDIHQELFKRAVDSVLENVRLLKEPPK